MRDASKIQTKLWERRIRISKRIPELRKHARILQILGPQGMSDDEREEQHGRISYRVQTPTWRNPALIPFLRAFDRIYAILKESSTLLDRRGNPVHERVPGDAYVS